MTRALRQPAQITSSPLWDEARNSGIHIQATRGSGKSSLEAIIALADLARGKPVVIFDVQGGLIEQLLWRLRFLSSDTRKALVNKIDYVDMSGKSRQVVGWPLLYELPGDSLFDIARRFIQLVNRLDPNLVNAPMFGANALEYLGTYTGMALYAMGCQFTEATDLLTHPERWTQRLRQAGQSNSEAEPAVNYFLNEYYKLPDHQRHTLSQTLRTKLAPFTLNPTLKAMFGASTPGIDWQEKAESSRLVILDFQDITNDDDLRFKMRCCFSHLWEYIKQRQNARDKPISIIIDELSYLLSMRAGSDDLLAADLDNFINKDMRYRNVWLTVAHQEQYQIPERIQKTLMSMGTQIIGQTSDREAAEALAKMYLQYRPFWEKKRIPRWAVMTRQRLEMVPTGGGSHGMGVSPVMWNHQYIKTVDHVTEEFSLEEQLEFFTTKFMRLRRFHFLLAHSGEEGSLSRELKPVNIERQVKLIPFPNQELVARDRELLIERSGTPMEAISEQIQQRQLPTSTSAPRRRSG